MWRGNASAVTLLIAALLVWPLGLVGCGSSGTPTTPPPGTALGVLSTVPADGAANVSAELDEMVINFDQPVDPTSVTAASVRVVGPGGLVPGDLMMAIGGEALFWEPLVPMGSLVTYDVTIDSGLRSLSGGELGTDYEFDFKVEPDGAAVTPTFVGGQIADTTSISCLVTGEFVTEPPQTVSFVSNDTNVATVDGNGLVTLAGLGRTTIDVTMDGFVAEIPVAVGEMFGAGTAHMSTEALFIDAPTLYTHVWDLTEEGLLDDGGYDQYDGVWDLSIDNQTAALDESFPDVALAEVTYDGPYAWHDSFRLEEDDSWRGKYRSGTAAGHLRPLGESAMYQEIVLPAAPGELTLWWFDQIVVNSVFGEEVGVRILVEDLTGGTGTTEVWSDVDTDSISETSWVQHSADLLPWAGETVRLWFVLKGGENEGYAYGWVIDDARLLDVALTDYLVNGDFESGATGWTGRSYLIPREVNLAPVATVADLQVTRSAYAPLEDGFWLRYYDTFTNPGATPVTVTIRYDGDLGSDGAGVVYPAHGDRALLEYDTDDSDPPLGILPGMVQRTELGNEDWSFEYDLTIGPGQTVSILAFHMFGDEVLDAPNAFLEALAGDMLDSIDELAAASPYLAGLTQAELDRVVNWP